MSRFEKYFLMNNEDVIEYVKEKTDFFQLDDVLTCEEIGDGNLNYVFHVIDASGKKSVIVKQAGGTARISEDIKLSTNRIKIESNVLMLHGKFANGYAPEVYLYDDVMNCCVMEDLSDHTILREGLIHFNIYPKLAEHLSTFMVQTLLPTTDVMMEHKEKKEQVKAYINPELCEISEDLVFSEPFIDYNRRNDLFPSVEEWLKKEVYEDEALRLEAAKMKFSFMTNAQALIHGDLHTGSVFVTEVSTKVIDPEFAFYGPIGYDVGNVIAHLVFASVRGEAYEKTDFTNWAKQTLVDVVDQFNEKFATYWEEHVTEIMAKQPGFQTWYLEQVLADTAGIAGLELIRRIVGLAKVKDITSIDDTTKRARAEKICITYAKDLIKNRNHFKTGTDFVTALTSAMNKTN